MTHTQLGLVILAVADLPGMVQFYHAAFGWDRSVDSPVYVEFALPNGVRIGLYERHAFGKNTLEVPVRIPPGALAPVELYFYPDDLDSAIERVRESGARTLSALSPRTWGDEVAYFADPEGSVIALARPLPRS